MLGAIALTLAFPPSAETSPTLGLSTNASEYRVGDSHVISVSLTTAEATIADVYLVLQIPGGALFSLVGAGLAPGVQPFLAGVGLPAGFQLASQPIFSLALPAIPVGTYTWFVALTAPGTLSLGSNLAQVNWSFTDTPVPTGPVWLAEVNFWRQRAHLPAVTENPTFSHGDELHATYTVKTDDVQHAENPASPFYTDEGDQAARASNGAASTSASTPDSFAIEAWLQAPFHAVGVLDPRLATTGFGSYREAGSPGIRMSGWLDVLRGRAALASGYPVMWPGNGSVIPVPNEELCPAGHACFWGETPSPLTSCPGYSTPAGLPLLLQLGSGNDIVASDPPSIIGAHSLARGGTPVDHCVISEVDYVNPDAAQQTRGRSILAVRDAVVIVPRDPLPAGTYDVSIAVKGTTYQWSFTIDPASQPNTHRVLPDWVSGALPPTVGSP